MTELVDLRRSPAEAAAFERCCSTVKEFAPSTLEYEENCSLNFWHERCQSYQVLAPERFNLGRKRCSGPSASSDIPYHQASMRARGPAPGELLLESVRFLLRPARFPSQVPEDKARRRAAHEEHYDEDRDGQPRRERDVDLVPSPAFIEGGEKSVSDSVLTPK